MSNQAKEDNQLDQDERILANVRAIRKKIRSGNFCGQTSNCASGVVQGNICILEKKYAHDFERYCDLNRKACSLIGKSDPGTPLLPELGDIDIRTDVPSYWVFRNGEKVAEVTDIHDLWNENLVAFVLGCSFSFEEALCQAGLTPRHIEEDCNAAMYVTNIETTQSGPFHGPLVVSMRPYTAENTIEAICITARFPRTHGAPIYFGDPLGIGIKNLEQPDFGDPVTIRDNEYPVFWACGVTPQAAIKYVKPPICITHKPGCMLITDKLSNEFMD